MFGCLPRLRATFSSFSSFLSEVRKKTHSKISCDFESEYILVFKKEDSNRFGQNLSLCLSAVWFGARYPSSMVRDSECSHLIALL